MRLLLPPERVAVRMRGNVMSLETYRVTCQRGHDPVTLTGQAALDHIVTCHGRKVGTVLRPTTAMNWNESARQPAYVWRPCDRVVKARPWKAPRAPREIPADFLAKLPDYGTDDVRVYDGIRYRLRSTDPYVTHEYVTDDATASAA